MRKLKTEFKIVLREAMNKRVKNVRQVVEQSVDKALKHVDEAQIEHIYPIAKEAAARSAVYQQFSEAFQEAVDATIEEAKRMVASFQEQVYSIIKEAIKQAQQELLEELENKG